MNSPEGRPAPPIVVEPDRRRHPRYSVNVEIEVHREGSYDPMHLETTDLSRGGCYVRPTPTLPVGIRVQSTLWLDGCPAVIQGRVITRHPEYGNGIMFMDFEGQAEGLLQRYLEAIIT
jgi:PilZ domain